MKDIIQSIKLINKPIIPPVKSKNEIVENLKKELELEKRKSLYWMLKSLNPNTQITLVGSESEIFYILGGKDI